MSYTIKKVRNKEPDVKKASYIADGVFIAGDVRLGENVSIWSNCSIRGDLASIIIGDNSNVQENTVIHVSQPIEEDYKKDPTGHVVIGKNTTIGHSCVIHACQIGNNCLIGMGSVIGDGCVIEDNAFIGAASNLTPRTIVRSGEMWFGNPARFMRNLRAQDIEYMKKDVDIYLSLSYEFNKE